MATRASAHQYFMSRALELARKAEGWTSPNPMVGAVIVKGGRVLGEGYHRRAGLPHAEVEALRAAGARARGSTLYVTLEPCDHYGRTPPCTDAILASGVSRLVVAARDPHSITNGRGLARLRRAGIRVTTGVMAQAAQRLNEAFHKAVTTGLPLVVAKVGQSLDGKIATVRGESRWITSPASRRLAHQWRSRVDAVLVGVNTVIEDDPRLTARGRPGRRSRPIKIIVDSRLRTPRRARCLSSASPAPTLIATTTRHSTRRTALERRGANILVFRPQRGRVPLRELCRVLVGRGIQSILVEGGAEVLASAFMARLVDRVVWFIAPVLLGGRNAPGALGGQGIGQLRNAVRLTDVEMTRVGPDFCVEARVLYPGGRGRGAGGGGSSRVPRPAPRAPSQ